MTFQSKNFFEILGLEEKLQIDPKLVQKKFYEMSRKAHPDFHQTSINKGLSEEYSALINQAFQTLKNKEKRLLYVIEQYLGSISTQADKKNAPKELLMELIDMQEALMDFKQEPSETHRHALEQLLEELNEKINGYDEKIDELIVVFDEASAKEEKTDAITKLRDLHLTKNYVRSLKRTFLDALEPTE